MRERTLWHDRQSCISHLELNHELDYVRGSRPWLFLTNELYEKAKLLAKHVRFVRRRSRVSESRERPTLHPNENSD